MQAAASAARAYPRAPCRVVTERRGYLQFRRDPNHFRFHVRGQPSGRSRPHTGRHVLSPHTHHARPGLPLPWHTQHTRWQCSAPGVGCAVRVLGCLGLAAAGWGLGWPLLACVCWRSGVAEAGMRRGLCVISVCVARATEGRARRKQGVFSAEGGVPV
jgi:hypothetical protein